MTMAKKLEEKTPMLLVVSLFMGFGFSACVDLIDCELPLLVQILPEYWKLPSYIGLERASGNIAVSMFIFAVMKLLPSVYGAANSKRPLQIFVAQVFKSSTVALIALYWNKTTEVLGAEHSTVLQTLWLLLNVVVSVEHVAIVTLVGTFPKCCMSVLYIGIASTGTIFGALGLLQRVGQYDCVLINGSSSLRNQPFDFLDADLSNSSAGFEHKEYKLRFKKPSFTISTCFTIAAGFIAICAVSDCLYMIYSMSSPPTEEAKYTILECNGNDEDDESFDRDEEPIAKTELSQRDNFKGRTELTPITSDCSLNNENEEFVENPDSPKATKTTTNDESNICDDDKNTETPTFQTFILVVYSFTLSGIYNGLFKPLMTFALLPYGVSTYNLARQISLILNPVGSLAFMFLPLESLKSLSTIYCLFLVSSVYVCGSAIMSPMPPFIETYPDVGRGLAVAASVITAVLMQYLRAALATVSAQKGQWTLALVSLAVEASNIVMIPTFLCINVFELLTEIPRC